MSAEWISGALAQTGVAASSAYILGMSIDPLTWVVVVILVVMVLFCSSPPPPDVDSGPGGNAP